MTDADFLREIAAAPHDRTPRLIHADWLDDHGDPRAEAVPLTHAILNGQWGDVALHSRLAQLFAQGVLLPTPEQTVLPHSGQTLRLLPPGTFLMGSPANEPARRDNENQAAVTLTQGFWLGQTPVTQDLYAAVTGGQDPSHFKGPRRPVERVSWDDAVEFCQKLTAQVARGGSPRAGRISYRRSRNGNTPAAPEPRRGTHSEITRAN